jgi:hypothetical protein
MKKTRIILNLINRNERFSPLFLVALCCLSFQIISAQETPTPPSTSKPVVTNTPPQCPPGVPCNSKPYPNPKATPNPTNTPYPRPYPTTPKPLETKKVIVNKGFAPAEKSIAVESKVNITLCVKEGNVKINGWDRDEVRAFVEDGSEVGFKIAQKNLKSSKPEWIYILGYDPQKNSELKPEECLSGSEIELDVPRNATINLNRSESNVRIESVGKVSVELLSGDIYLNDIANGIDATTYRGDITVANSSGKVILNNNGEGNILALSVSPSEIGDIFKAKTNSGRITLQAVEHRQIGTNSISGSTSFEGSLLEGGQYSFSTQNGSIGLAVPQNSLCKINAWFGFGAFNSEIPLQNTLKKEQSVSAQLGTSDATCSLNLKTGSGVIRIKAGKSEAKPVSKTFEKSPKLLSLKLKSKVICTLTTKTEVTVTRSKSGNR